MSMRIEAEVPTLFGNVLRQKRRAFPCKAGMAAELVAVVLDGSGNPLDFSAPVFQDAEWKARFVEASQMVKIVDAPTTVDSNNSRVFVQVPNDISSVPGVYELSVAALQNGSLLASNEYYVYVEPSVWHESAAARDTALPSIDRVRLSLRDSDVLENELLHSRQFFLTDIAQAAIDTVHAYNAAMPRILRLVVDTTCFPDPDLFMSGIRAFLFLNMVEHYRKNTLVYQAGNIAINDSKLQEYHQAAQEEIRRFEQGCMHIKAAYNLRRGIGWAGGYWG